MTYNAYSGEELAPAQARPQRADQHPIRLVDYELVHGNEVDLDREIMHIVIFENGEPI